MKTILNKIAKSIVVIVVTFLVFVVLKNTIAQVGGMPQAFKAAYSESYFVKAGIFYPAIIFLMTVILIHLIVNYAYLQKNIPCVARARGILFGSAFGMLWFFGFLELVVTYHSNFFRHITSGVRDLISLTVFGILVGILFTPRTQHIEKKRETIGVVLYTAVFFTLFHGMQYVLTFKALEQRVDDIATICWLFVTGAWIGIMYYYFSPKMNNVVLKITFFAVNTFGINWSLYTSFYNLFLDIPVFDLLMRCVFDIAGIFIGLLLYEYMKTRSSRAVEAHGEIVH